MVRIEQWAVVYISGDAETAPEHRERILMGKVYGHPRFEDGFDAKTSVIIGQSESTEAGHVVTTESRDYLLGEPSKSFIEHLARVGIVFDPEQPVRVAVG